MGVVKVIEVLAQSEESWEHAVQKAVDETSKTVRNIKTVYVKDFQAIVEGNKVTKYRATTKIAFEVAKQREA